MRRKVLISFISLLILFFMIEQIHAANLVKVAFGGDSVTGEQKEVKVMFNPEKVSIMKTVPWKENEKNMKKFPKLQFTSGTPVKIELKLLFEAYSTGENVQEITDRIELYAETENPECVLSWLSGGDEIICFLDSVKVEFIEFYPDGTPAAANADCVFKNFSMLNSTFDPGSSGTTDINTFIINQE